jgi:CRP-like cAMP-binding protein
MHPSTQTLRVCEECKAKRLTKKDFLKVFLYKPLVQREWLRSYRALRSSTAGSSMTSADARAAQAAEEALAMASLHSMRASLAVFDV